MKKSDSTSSSGKEKSVLLKKELYPLMPWTGAFFALGILWGDCFMLTSAYSLLITAFFISLCAFFLRKKYAFVSAVLCVTVSFLLGMARISASTEKMISEYGLLKNSSTSSVHLTGRVISFPQIKNLYSKKNNSTSYRIKFYCTVSEIEKNSPDHKILFYLYTDNLSTMPIPGDRIECVAGLSYPPRFVLNRTLTYRDYLSFRDVFLIAKVKDASAFHIQKRNPFYLFLWNIRMKLLNHLAEGISGTVEIELIKGMILGESVQVHASVFNRFVALGTIHVLIISGFHVGCIAFFGITILQYAGLKRLWAEVVLIPILIFYLYLVGFQVSVQRAVVMVIFYWAADFINRERNAINALTGAGILQLAFMPRLIYDHGFQYSFLCVTALIFVYPIFRGLINKNVPGFIVSALLSAFAVWIVIAPLAAYRNSIFCPSGFILGIITLLCSNVIIVVGLVSALAGFVSGFLSETFNFFNYFLIKLILDLHSLFYDLIGGKYYFHFISYWWLFFYFLGLIGCLAAFKSKVLQVSAMCTAFMIIVLIGIFPRLW